MSQKIQIRRGTKSQLDNLMSGAGMLAGELGFTTDTHEVFCSDGTNVHQIGGVLVDTFTNRPAAGVSGRMFLASDTSISYIDNGTAWVTAGVADLDQIADGTTYGKVKNSELESGQVKQVRAVSASTDITGDTLHAHLEDDTIHRQINDSGAGSTDLFSAQKISALVEAAQTGLDAKNSVNAGTVEALPSNTYSNGVITASSNGALAAIDGVTLGVADRILVKNEAVASHNGIYVVTEVGDGSTAFVLTRSSDADNTPETGEVTTGMYCFIEEGTVQVNQGWILTTTGSITLGSSDLNFSQFNGAGSLFAGDGLSKTGNIFNIDVSDFAGTGIEDDGSENLRLAVQGNGIAGGNGSVLSVDRNTVGGANLASAISVTSDGVAVMVDGVTVEDDGSGNLRVKDLGITTAKLDATSVTAAKLGNDILGDGLTGADGSAIALASTVAGNGLTFASGVINVVAGNGFTVVADSIDFDVDDATGTTVAPLAVSANGVGVTVDNVSIVHSSGELQVASVDGGSF